MIKQPPMLKKHKTEVKPNIKDKFHNKREAKMTTKAVSGDFREINRPFNGC